MKLQLSARLSVELNALAAAEPAPDDALVAVTRLHQGQLQLLDLGPVVALHDALQDAVLGAHVEAVVPVAHQAPRPLLLLEPAALHKAPVEERVITEENQNLTLYCSTVPVHGAVSLATVVDWKAIRRGVSRARADEVGEDALLVETPGVVLL